MAGTRTTSIRSTGVTSKSLTRGPSAAASARTEDRANRVAARPTSRSCWSRLIGTQTGSFEP